LFISPICHKLLLNYCFLTKYKAIVGNFHFYQRKKKEYKNTRKLELQRAVDTISTPRSCTPDPRDVINLFCTFSNT
jgi:hypothetical protein